MIHTQSENKSIAAIKQRGKLFVLKQPADSKSALLYAKDQILCDTVYAEQSVRRGCQMVFIAVNRSQSVFYPPAKKIIEAVYIIKLIII